MPNHVVNHVTFNGSMSDVAQLLIKVSSVDNAFDFNNIIPMPESLNIESGSDADIAFIVLSDKEVVEKEFNSNQVYAFLYNNVDDYINRNKLVFDKMDDKRKKKVLELGEKVKHNITNYGFKGWYDWRIATWGTKWNSYSVKFENNTIEFQTAWSTPAPIFIKLSQMFPDVEIILKYSDEQMTANVGGATFRNGQIVNEYLLEGDNALRQSCELWGESYDEYLKMMEENLED